jgi:hypothetical protein
MSRILELPRGCKQCYNILLRESLGMFSTVLFLDAIGDMASWMYIPCLMDWNEAESYIWGLVVLSYLYHQLCEGRSHYSSLGGCTYLLCNIPEV